MKEKIRWIGILLVLLFCVFGITRWVDNSMVCGVQIIPTEKLMDLAEGMEHIEVAENIEELICFDGQIVPYNKKSNTFYVSQNADTFIFDGNFSVLGDNCNIYIEKDSCLENKSKAIREGHTFKLWIIDEQAYTTVNLIFTGLPILNLQMKQELSEEETPCHLMLYNPYDEEVNLYSIKTSESLLKEKIASGTLSLKLYNKDYSDGKKLNLLSIGKHSSWKLYPITEKDRNPVGVMLSAYVWNAICEGEDKIKLQRDFGMVEVFLNGEYLGLYCMAPKINETYLDLAEGDYLYRIEDVENTDNISFNSENRNSNICDYNFFLQLTGSMKNAEEDFFVMYDESEDFYYRIPAKHTFCFAEFPAEQGYLSMEAEKYIVQDEIFAAYIQDGTVQEKIKITEQWNTLRQNGLSTEELLTQAQQYQQLLEKSGYFARSGNEELVNRCAQVQQYVTKRMDYLDCYYGTIDGN